MKTAMKSKPLHLVLALVLAFVVVGCGKSEQPAAPAAESAAGGKTVDPATAGNLTGLVKFEGTPPRAQRIRMDADPACSRLHTSPVMTEDVVIGANNALANAVVYVKAGLEDYSFPAPTEAVVLDQHGCMYRPRVLSVMVNQPIEILNSDDTTHNIHPTPRFNREWNKSQAPRGEKLVERFAREEVAIPVKCNVHPWMKSHIAVLRHPYHDVSGADGTFSLEGLPPGTYTIEAWHETLGTATQEVTIGARESKTVEFVFRAS
jgi:plastocyanin